MKITARLFAAFIAGVMMFSGAAVHSSAGREAESGYYDAGSVKKFVELYRKDKEAGKNFFFDEVASAADGSCHQLLSADELSLFQKNADYAAVPSFIFYNEGSENTYVHDFCFTFFLADGSNYRTCHYSGNTVKALSVKQILRDSRVPDYRKIAAAELWYLRWDTNVGSFFCDFVECKNGWIPRRDRSGSLYTYGYYFRDDGTLVKETTTINGERWTFLPDGTCKGRYTGWTVNEDGRRRYYLNGKALSGWQRINGKRYHFGEGNYADTGEIRVANCTYTLSDKGVWNGKRTPTGARPADLNFVRSNYLEEYNSKSGRISRKTDLNDKNEPVYAYADLKLNGLDKQVLWSIIVESGLLNADTKVNYNADYVLKFADEVNKRSPGKYKDLWTSDPEISYTVTFTANKREYTYSFTSEIQQIIEDDRISAGLWNISSYIKSYVEESKAYKSLPPIDERMYLY